MTLTNSSNRTHINMPTYNKGLFQNKPLGEHTSVFQTARKTVMSIRKLRDFIHGH